MTERALGPKICIASSGLGHVARGIEAWASDLGGALAERGERVLVCKGGGEKTSEHERVVPCWTRESSQAQRLLARLPSRLGWRVGLGSGYGVEQTTFAWNLIKVLRQERIDILHVQDPQVARLVQRARSLGLVRARTILAHGTEETLAFQRRITYLQHLAPWHLEEARAAGVWKPTWTALPNFIDTELFRPGSSDELRSELGIPREALVVLSAAAIKRNHKRIDFVLNEFATLRQRHPDLPVWLVVAGGWERDTDALISEGTRLLGDRVRFLVRFPRERMAELFRASDVFVLASLFEMLGIVLLEAMASAVPCLAHTHPVLDWVVGPGGQTIDMSREGALAESLGTLLRDTASRQALGRQAREHCVANFGRDQVVGQILEYYEFVMRHGAQKEPERIAAIQ